MSGLIFIFICLTTGKLLSRYHDPIAIIRVLNLVLIRIALPAVIIDKIHSVHFSSDAILPILTPWILFIFIAGIVYLFKFWFKFSSVTTGCLILLCGTSNTSFVGIPLVNAWVGSTGIETAVIIDQSNLVLLFTVGIILANFYSGKEVNFKKIGLGLITYPPIIALIIAVLSRPFPFYEFIQYTLSTFGELLTPLAMLSIGCSLRLPKERGLIKLISLGLVIKLILAPTVIAIFIYLIFSGSSQTAISVSLMQAGMAPMVIAVMIASDKNLNPELASYLTGFGIPMSFITVAAWYYISLLL